MIDKIPESIAGKSIQKKVEVRSKIQGEELKTLIANADGSFCQMLKPGSYVFKVGHVVHIAVTLQLYVSVPARPLHHGATPCPRLDMPCAFYLAPCAFY